VANKRGGRQLGQPPLQDFNLSSAQNGGIHRFGAIGLQFPDKMCTAVGLIGKTTVNLRT
jgi:hypothetical protein